MHIEQPWKTSSEDLARRTATTVGLRALATEIEENHYKIQQWQSSAVSVGVATVHELHKVLWRHIGVKGGRASYFGSSVTVRLPVAAVQTYESQTPEVCVGLEIMLKTTEEFGVPVLAGYYADYANAGEIKESFSWNLDDETLTTLRDLFARFEIEFSEHPIEVSEERLAESKLKAQTEAAQKLRDALGDDDDELLAAVAALDSIPADAHLEAQFEERTEVEDVEPF